ncbi:MAG TPA: YchJ family protein [Motiliproteus sp.]
MTRQPLTPACPCGSDLAFSDCCQPRLNGSRPAETAQALMRSRYCAFALGYFDYLVETLHPDYRRDTSAAQLAAQDQQCRWLGLEILDCQAGLAQNQSGTVHFIARYLENGSLHELEENSAFVHHLGRWFYTQGETQFRTLGKLGRNDPCPCGSGKKFKQCHQR